MACVYRFKDIKGNVIYIGKTKRSLNERMSEHFGGKGHLCKECYKSVASIEYIKVPTDADSLLLEVYLINKYRPCYNKQNKSSDLGQTIKLNIEENWKTYKQFKPITEYKPNPVLNFFIGIGYIALLIYLIIFLKNILIY